MHLRLVIASIGIAVVSLVGLSAALAAAPGPDYLDVVAFTASAQNEHLAKLSVTTKASIPREPDAFISSNPVVGIAWADLDSGKVLVVTIHPVIGRDSNQRPDDWHAHTATLASGATAPNDFCLASIDSAPTAGIPIEGATMRVNIRMNELPVAPGAFDAAVGFTVQVDGACASGLGVRVST